MFVTNDHGLGIQTGSYSRTRVTENQSLFWYFKPIKPKVLFLQETIPTAVKSSGF